MNDSLNPGAREFSTTRWSVVRRARGDESAARTALAELCRCYWYPLYAFVRREGKTPHDAQDLTQEFFARLIEKNWLDEVAPERGRFRSWLLASMRHFLANDWHYQHAQKRGGSATVLSLDETDAEGRYLHEPTDPLSAEQLFDRRWALTLLDSVVTRLRDEMSATGKAAQFEILKGTLTGGKVEKDAAERLHLSDGALRVAAHRLRERYREMLRATVADTVDDPAEVEAELRQLFSALSV